MNHAAVYMMILRGVDTSVTHGRRPSIQATNQHELSVKIPVRKSSDNIHGLVEYHAQLSEIHQDANASFECFSEINREHRTLGAIEKKISILAADDVFQKTKERMNKVQELEKRNCIKKIDPLNVKKSTERPKRKKSAESKEKAQRSINKNFGVFPGIEKYGYRERLIHLLALRPLSLEDLVIRLKRDGVIPEDKEALHGIVSSHLKSIASLNTTNHTHTLLRHILKDEAQISWPFYSETERQLLGRQKKMIEETMVNNHDTFFRGPKNYVDMDNPDNNNSLVTSYSSRKRKSSLSHNSIDVHDKRIANHTESVSGGPSPVKDKKSKVISSRINDSSEFIEKKKHDKTSTKINITNGSSSPRSGTLSECPSLPTLSLVSESSKVQASTKSTSSNDNDSYLNEYVVIRDDGQRTKYKEAFNKEYDEYICLYKEMDDIRKRFSSLKSSIKELTPGDEEYKILREKTYSEYASLKSDTEYLKKRKRYEHLLKKLGHIKSLITVYDGKKQNISEKS